MGADTILCVGELLWDALPAGLFLGGAPFNVAAHLTALGEDATVASRVGTDRLGREARRRLRARGLDTALLQTDETRPTGFVRVALEATAAPDYDIVAPAAWDALALTDPLKDRAEAATALVFGSLGQRASQSRQTIRTLCRHTDGLRVFDVNLRPPYDDRSVVDASLRLADVVKLNDHELARLRDWVGLPPHPDAALAELGTTFGCRIVCVTAGDEGARLWIDGTNVHHPGYDVDVADPVGAGDAFLAALLSGVLADWPLEALLPRANRLGAYVAAQPGAAPIYEVRTPAALADLPLPTSPGP